MKRISGRGLRHALAAAALVAAATTSFQSASAMDVTTLVDNEKFTLIKVTFAAGEHQEKLHPPPGTGQIATLITPADMKMDLDDNGKASTDQGHMEPGKTWWLSKTTLHRLANIGKTPLSLIVVTLKQ